MADGKSFLVVRSTGKRRCWSADEKRRIVEETLAPEDSEGACGQGHVGGLLCNMGPHGTRNENGIVALSCTLYGMALDTI